MQCRDPSPSAAKMAEEQCVATNYGSEFLQFLQERLPIGPRLQIDPNVEDVCVNWERLSNCSARITCEGKAITPPPVALFT
jgi:hypothetical protein